MPAELRPDDEAELSGDAETVIAERRRGGSDARRLASEEIGFATRPVRPPIGDRLAQAAGVVAILIALAVLKPWAPAGGDVPTGRPRPVVAASPATTPELTRDSPEGVAGPICHGAGAWRVASLETWRGQDVRVWRAVEPISEATGPLDPEIPTVHVVGQIVGALGWCAPSYGPDRPIGPPQIDSWIVIDGTAHELELLRVIPIRGTTHLAALYVPVAPCPLGATCPPERDDVAQRWATGRVVFRYEDLGASTTVWFGADVELDLRP